SLHEPPNPGDPAIGNDRSRFTALEVESAYLVSPSPQSLRDSVLYPDLIVDPLCARHLPRAGTVAIEPRRHAVVRQPGPVANQGTCHVARAHRTISVDRKRDDHRHTVLIGIQRREIR